MGTPTTKGFDLFLRNTPLGPDEQIELIDQIYGPVSEQLRSSTLDTFENQAKVFLWGEGHISLTRYRQIWRGGKSLLYSPESFSPQTQGLFFQWEDEEYVPVPERPYWKIWGITRKGWVIAVIHLDRTRLQPRSGMRHDTHSVESIEVRRIKPREILGWASYTEITEKLSDELRRIAERKKGAFESANKVAYDIGLLHRLALITSRTKPSAPVT